MTWGWDWDHQSYSRVGSGFLGLGDAFQYLYVHPETWEEDFTQIHPGKLTWNTPMEVWKMIFRFKGVICRL